MSGQASYIKETNNGSVRTFTSSPQYGQSSSSYDTIASHRYKMNSAWVNSDGVIPTDYSILSGRAVGRYNAYEKVYQYTDDGKKKYLTASTSGSSLGGNVQSPLTSNSLSKLCHPTRSSGFITWPASEGEHLSNALLSKIDNQAMDIGAIGAELLETSAYIAARGALIARFGISLFTGNFPRAFRQLGLSKKAFRKVVKTPITKNTRDAASLLGSRFLELNFAIRPLVSDISDSVALYNTPEKVLGAIKYRASASRPIKILDMREQDSGSTLNTDWVELTGTLREKCVYSVTDPETVAKKALGLNNLPASAWEAVPFSWLLDYVVGVGDFLQLMTATEGLAFKHGFKSFRFEEARRARSISNYPLANGGYARYTNTGQAHYSGYYRQRIYSFPRPTVKFTLPEITRGEIYNVVALGAVLSNKNRKLHAVIT